MSGGRQPARIGRVTVATDFYLWQRSDHDWSKPPWTACSPNLAIIRNHLIHLHGGMNLGCHHERSIVGGSLPSSHAYGAATDWGYAQGTHGGPGRKFVEDELLDKLVAYSHEYGIQAIHDYAGGRIWRAWRPPPAQPGWRVQPLGSQMGRPWAEWLHLETHISRWHDSRSIAERFRTTTPTPTSEVNMILLDHRPGEHPGWTALIWDGIDLAHAASGEAVTVLERAKVPRQTVSDVEIDGIILASRTTTPCPITFTGDRRHLWESRRR